MAVLAWLYHDPWLSWTSIAWCLGAGAANGFAIAALYRALAIGKMGLTAPVAAVLTTVLPLLFAIRTGGRPRAVQFAGFIFALIGIWLIAKPEGSAARPAGLGLAVLAGMGFSGFLLMIKLANTSAVYWPVGVARAASLGLMLAIVLFRREAWVPGKNSFWIAALAGSADAFGSTLFLLALHYGRLDVAAVLSSLYPASTVILARIFLKEHLSGVQRLGMISAIIAVPLIAWK